MTMNTHGVQFTLPQDRRHGIVEHLSFDSAQRQFYGGKKAQT